MLHCGALGARETFHPSFEFATSGASQLCLEEGKDWGIEALWLVASYDGRWVDRFQVVIGLVQGYPGIKLINALANQGSELQYNGTRFESFSLQ